MLYPTDLTTYHYAWWRPDKFKEIRYAQLNRDKSYWNEFDFGLQEIKMARNINGLVVKLLDIGLKLEL